MVYSVNLYYLASRFNEFDEYTYNLIDILWLKQFYFIIDMVSIGTKKIENAFRLKKYGGSGFRTIIDNNIVTLFDGFV